MMDAVDQQALTGAVIKLHNLDIAELWLDYVALGGDASEQEIRDYSLGTGTLPEKERDALSHSVNERCAEADLVVRAPYSNSPLAVMHAGPKDPYSSK
jgi:hypothetical protein